MLCLVCKRLLSTRNGEGKGEGMLHLWYHVPYLSAVSGSSRDDNNSRVAVSIVARYLFTGVFLCEGTGLVVVYCCLTMVCTESHLISKGSQCDSDLARWPLERHTHRLSVSLGVHAHPPPPPQWVVGTWHQHYSPHRSLTEHLLGRQPPPQPPPFNPQSGVPIQGHGTFQPDTDARWPDWPVHTAPPVALGPQPESHADSWRRRERRRRMQGTNSHKGEQVEWKLTGSAERLNVRNSGQGCAWKVNRQNLLKW